MSQCICCVPHAQKMTDGTGGCAHPHEADIVEWRIVIIVTRGMLALFLRRWQLLFYCQNHFFSFISKTYKHASVLPVGGERSQRGHFVQVAGPWPLSSQPQPWWREKWISRVRALKWNIIYRFVIIKVRFWETNQDVDLIPDHAGCECDW